ncbi:het domain protein [Colletotrichum camelliae]|nr:het domain protein [Colletotrichum camelliae]
MPEVWNTCRLEIAAKSASANFIKGDQTNKTGMQTPEDIYSWLELQGNFLARPECQLDRRGWTFQERLLSTRILTVTENGLFWDCCTISATDKRLTRLKGDHSPAFRDSEERSIKRLLLANNKLSTEIDRSEIFCLWRRILRDYSRRTFSHPVDRVIALQGIVDRVESLLEERCFLGIWRGDAIRSLIWFCEKPDPDPVTPKCSRHDIVEVPSWSWASVSIPIHYKVWHPMEGFRDKKNEDITPCARLLSITVQLADEAHFSAYTGEVVLYGPLVQLPMGLRSGPGYQTFTDKALYLGQDAETFDHGGVGASSIPLAAFLGQRPWTSGFFSAREERENERRPESSKEVFLLPIFKEKY